MFGLTAPSKTEQNASFRVVVDVFKNPVDLGVTKEFALVTVDGQLKHIFVVSTANPDKYTIEGSFPLEIETTAGHGKADFKAYPWHRSAVYQNSPMFWGLHIKSGFWIHSTPHYGQLGRPASMGCVRISFPAAMELWDEVVNRANGSAIINIYGSKSEKARAALASKQLDISWLNARIDADLEDAHAMTKGDYKGYGHPRPGQPLVWPTCQGADCFDYFGVKKPL